MLSRRGVALKPLGSNRPRGMGTWGSSYDADTSSAREGRGMSWIAPLALSHMGTGAVSVFKRAVVLAS